MGEIELLNTTGLPLYPTWFRWKAKRSCLTHLKISFISHMVQMKGVKQLFFTPIVVLYIPHGSDESFFLYHRGTLRKSALYPTWFRWKKNRGFFSSINKKLYIPHGSDESWVTVPTSWLGQPFISHMVQMKESAFEEIQNPMATLYPTWFRWKLNSL